MNDSSAVSQAMLSRIPIRTCVGCRRRAPAPELLRIVGVAAQDDRILVVPDPARRRPGRGASLHPDPACLALAERRRAFGRALRHTGVIEVEPLRQYLAGR
jgi:uncharacterized protein